MSEPIADSTGTVDALLATLRSATGHEDLDFAEPPVALRGGFYADLWRIRLIGAPAGLDGDLVARIVPNPAAGAWESVIQGYVSSQGFATPAVRLSVDEHSPLGRYLMVMDHVDGGPPMAGLRIETVVRQIPSLVRQLPDLLADVAVALHRIDPAPLAAQLESLADPLPLTTEAFVRQQVELAGSVGDQVLASAGERVLGAEPPSRERVVAHGDLHPFNLLMADDGPVLIDWSVARVAHPGFTLAFADLMLGHPPLALPRVGAAALALVTRRMAGRFLARYRSLAPAHAQVSADELAWHRQVHALRILAELAGWDAAGTRPASGHPWLVLEPVARRELGMPPI